MEIVAAASPADTAITFCIIVLGLGLGLSIGAVLLRAATFWVVKVHLKLGRAFLLVIVANVLAAVAYGCGYIVLGLILQRDLRIITQFDLQIKIGANLVALLIASWLYGRFIEDNCGPIGAGNGALIALIMFGIGIAIAALVYGGALLFFGPRFFT